MYPLYNHEKISDNKKIQMCLEQREKFRIRSFSGLNFPAFGQIRRDVDTNTFHAVLTFLVP